MEFNDVVNSRYSVREFTEKNVSENLINEIINVGRIAPSAGNKQPTVVYVLDEGKLRLLKENPLSKVHKVVLSAKKAIMVCCDKNLEMSRHYDDFSFGITDASIVTTYMMLKITELGLGTTWIGMFNSEVIKEILKLPKELEVVSILPVGYISEDNKPNERHYLRKDIKDFRRL